ncbi:hypothetical protein OHA99_26735 [Streptomyces coelicoflavus]|uniref:hypothetical protein n=1 Tax=Streptomyces coelicoflavus TaxID=285562 RepID=UPI00325270F1
MASRTRLAARLELIEQARGEFRITFRTEAGRTFTLDVADVLAICMDCLTWVYADDPDAERPRGRIIEQLATAVTEDAQGLIGNTAILAAQHAMGVQP